MSDNTIARLTRERNEAIAEAVNMRRERDFAIDSRQETQGRCNVVENLALARATESAQKLAAAIERAEKLEIRRREGRQLLHRLIKYVREDRAVTPGSTRLVRLVDDVDDYMKRTNDPNDILRATEPPPPEATCPTCGGNGWFLAPPDDRRAVCDDCHGSGKYPQAVSLGGRPAVTIDLRCESCQGTGRAPRPEPPPEAPFCPHCAGVGFTGPTVNGETLGQGVDCKHCNGSGRATRPEPTREGGNG